MSNRLTKTHRRPMRPVTPATHASRGLAGAAIAATFVLTGSSMAQADGNAEAGAVDAQAAGAVAAPEAAAVEIPAATAADGSAFGAVAEAPKLTIKTFKTSDDDSNNEKRDEKKSSKKREERNDEQKSSSKKSKKKREERSADDSQESSSSAGQVVAGGSIIATAHNGIGVRYVSGGTTPAGWDCSGFVQWVFKQHGINLPRTDAAQAAYATRISASEARPGDLIRKPGHIGIYAGNGMMIDAGNSRKDTSLRKVYSGNWSYYRVTR